MDYQYNHFIDQQNAQNTSTVYYQSYKNRVVYRNSTAVLFDMNIHKVFYPTRILPWRYVAEAPSMGRRLRPAQIVAHIVRIHLPANSELLLFICHQSTHNNDNTHVTVYKTGKTTGYHFYRAAWNADAVLHEISVCLSVCLSVRLSVRLSVCQTRAL